MEHQAHRPQQVRCRSELDARGTQQAAAKQNPPGEKGSDPPLAGCDAHELGPAPHGHDGGSDTEKWQIQHLERWIQLEGARIEPPTAGGDRIRRWLMCGAEGKERVGGMKRAQAGPASGQPRARPPPAGWRRRRRPPELVRRGWMGRRRGRPVRGSGFYI